MHSEDPLPAAIESELRRIATLRGEARAAAADALLRAHPALAEQLRSRLAAEDRPNAADEDSMVETDVGRQDHVAARLAALEARRNLEARYLRQGEIARGGMGSILRVFDEDLRRPLAMKVVLGRDAPDAQASVVDPNVLERFLEEAQITGQLDHPGVVPVHDLGIGKDGRVYFTMRLVRGRTAQEIFQLARERAEGWTPTRAIEVMLKVCDTLAYAHSKSVVHRDLKPSNVMVGRYGEVYVMDWGLAKVLGRPDNHDLRIREDTTNISRVRTDRSNQSESDPDSALRTMDGAIVGTPCYMPPEQADGRVEDIGVQSDVYGAGAMLYTLLTGVQPYIRPGSKTSPYMVLQWVREGPPEPIHRLDPLAPAELVAVCERAMARQPADRYASMADLADDLRAWLEHRVVRAYRTGARAELGLWIRRNRGMAAGFAAAFLALLLGGAGAFVYARQATDWWQEALQQKRDADAARTTAEQALADLQEQQRLRDEADERLRKQRIRAASDVRKASATAQRKAEERARQNTQTLLGAERRRSQIREQARLAMGLEDLVRAFASSLVGLAPTAVPGPKPDPVDRCIDAIGRQFDLLHEVWGQWMRARWLALVGRPTEATQALDRMELLTDQLQQSDDKRQPNPEKAKELIDVANALRLSTRADVRQQLARSAEALADQLDALALLREAHARTGVAELRLRAIDEARAAARLLLAASEPQFVAAQLAAVEQWLARSGAKEWDKDTASQTPTLALLLAACDVLRGRLAAATSEFQQLAANGAAMPDGLARCLRESGQIAAALTILGAPDSHTDNGEDGAFAMAMATARCWRAVHQPHRAAAAIDAALARLASVGADPRRIALLLTRAECAADVGGDDLASATLQQATAFLPRDADALALDLSRAQANLDLLAGEPDRAILHLTGGLAATAAAAIENLAAVNFLPLARAARCAGSTALAESALRAAKRPVQAPAPADIELLLEQAALLIATHQDAALAPVLEQMDNLRPSLRDPLAATRTSALTALHLASLGNAQAITHLERATRSFGAWLSAYGRFAGEPIGAKLQTEVAETATAALTALAVAGPTLDAAALPKAWLAFETFRDVVGHARATRSADLARRSQQAPEVADYLTRIGAMAEATARRNAASLGRRSTSGGSSVADPVTVARELDAFEARFRRRWPVWAGALWPQPTGLDAIAAAVPADTALVSFAATDAAVLAFVVARGTARILTVAADDELRTTLAQLQHHRSSDVVAVDRIASTVLQRVLADAVAPTIRTLVLAPDATLAAVPWESALVPAGDGGAPLPLLASHHVTFAPAATAWRERLQPPGPAAGKKRNVTIAGAAARETEALAVAALSPFLDDGERGALAAASPTDAVTGHVLRTPGTVEEQLGALARGSRALLLTVDADSFSPADLRDLDADLDLAVVRDPAADALGQSRLRAAAGALWCGGAPIVLGVAGEAGPGECAVVAAVAAVAAARASGEEMVAAFAAAWRQEWRAGRLRSATSVRLWCAKR